MKVTLKGQSGLEVTQAMRGYLENSLREIEDVFVGDVQIEAKCKIEKHIHTVEISVRTLNHTLRVKTISENYYDSVDDAVAKLKKNVRKYKDKLIDVKRKTKEEFKKNECKTSDELIDKAGEVVKIKKIDVEAMTKEEALFQMNLLGHSFYLFIDIDTNSPTVVYIRQDGTFGMIAKA